MIECSSSMILLNPLSCIQAFPFPHQYHHQSNHYLKIVKLNSLRYNEGDQSNSNHLRDAFLASIPEDNIEVDTTFANTFILFLREQIPASSTFFYDQCSALKALDVCKFPSINVKDYLKTAK